MPGWKTHLGAGVITALVLLVFFNEKLNISLTSSLKGAVTFVIIILIGSLFPDLDIRNSKVFGIFLGIATVTIIISFVRGYTYLGIVTTLTLSAFSYMKHRGILHSLSVLGITSLIVYTATLSFSFSILWAACYLSHLMLDRELKIL